MQAQFLSQCISAAHAANQRREFSAAVGWCNQALHLAPNIPEAWYNLALAFSGLGKRAEALSAFERTRALTQGNANAQNSISLQLIELGALDEAERCLNQAIQLVPDYVFAISNLGRLRQKQGRHGDAEALFRKAIGLNPDLAPLHVNLCGILNAQGKRQAAETAARRAIELDSASSEAWSNLAAALHGLKHHEPAEAAARRATQLDPSSPEAWSNLAAALHGLKHHEPAEAAARKATELDPASPEAWSNLAAALHGLRRYGPAEVAARRATELDPASPEAWSNLATALRGLRRYEPAEVAARRAAELAPASSEAWSNLGDVLQGMKHHQAAAEAFQKAVECDPGAPYALGNLLHNKMIVCDWREMERDVDILLTRLAGGEPASYPFVVLGLSADPAIQLAAAKAYVADQCPEDLRLGMISRPPRRDRIRVGYYSADLREHPVSYLMAGVFESHDKDRFESVGFSFGANDGSEIRERMAAAFDEFIEVGDRSDLEVAELSRSLGIDIAVDLGGFTQDARTGVFALRAAPIQVSYLGYLGTMGASYIDYLLADATIIPQAQRQYYSEKIAYLPWYQANDTERPISDRRFSRQELGLPKAGFVFCCFNNNYKITPETFDGWMRILGRVEDSVLLLFVDNDLAAENLKREAARRNVDPARIVSAGRLPRPEYLARYRAADLFLDTQPYNAGTTASDALWAGLPVLTLMGTSFASRVAASLLDAIGMPELIATSQAEYEELAVRLATQPEALGQAKEKLARNRLTAPLFDTPSFTRHIEAAYRAMYERHQAGLEPEHIIVPTGREN